MHESRLFSAPHSLLPTPYFQVRSQRAPRQEEQEFFPPYNTHWTGKINKQSGEINNY